MKRKFELGRPPAMTKLQGPKRVRVIRTRGYVAGPGEREEGKGEAMCGEGFPPLSLLLAAHRFSSRLCCLPCPRLWVVRQARFTLSSAPHL